MCNKKIPLVSIVGPTASGKTSLSIQLAKLLDGEIISADSMQIYKGMDIATAKPTESEKQGIVHHLMDFLDADKTFSVAQYCKLAHSVIEDINNRGKLPILVGGTGLYVDSLINNIAFAQTESDEQLRNSLYQDYENNGADYLLEILAQFDSETAGKLAIEKNVKRIIRAIEVYKTTGVTMSEHNANSKLIKSPYKTVKIGLTATDRQFLYERINKRVDIMVENGLIDEARDTVNMNLSSTSSMAIGHKELMPYLNDESSLDTCIENLKMQTRHYAKRQLTWFKRDEEINWFYIDLINNDDLVKQTQQLIKKVMFDE